MALIRGLPVKVKVMFLLLSVSLLVLSKIFGTSKPDERQHSLTLLPFCDKNMVAEHLPPVTSRELNASHSRGQRAGSWYSVQTVSCPLLWKGNEAEQRRAMEVQSKNPRCERSLLDYLEATENCTKYLQDGGFTKASISKDELTFPLAFSILIYRDASQVERLLRAIYRPHNFYCIHVDLKADTLFHYKVALFARCLPNVFISNISVDVQWGTFTTLEAELICLRQLWHRGDRWRYFVNLTGQEFPLKTNKELVRILRAYNGANDIQRDFNQTRAWYRWDRYLPAPFNLRVTKGAVHIAASRDFVDYVLHSDVARKFLQWEKQTLVPDEAFFNTLNFDPQLGTPGSPSDIQNTENATQFTRYKIWWCKPPETCPCGGKFVREVCTFGVGDLPRLTTSTQMFANKFSYDYQPLALDCLEQWYFHRLQQEDAGNAPVLDITPYQQAYFVQTRYRGPVKIW